MKPVIRVLAPASVDDSKLSYVVMGARHLGKWIFVRHRDRQTWEMPAGHIEPGEDPRDAAIRELYEEAGVSNSSLELITDYSVTSDGETGFGRFYLAEVKKLEALPDHEIEEIKLSPDLPAYLTYPEVQTLLFSLLSLH